MITQVCLGNYHARYLHTRTNNNTKHTGNYSVSRQQANLLELFNTKCVETWK